jgi:hypothetical protein
VEHEELLDRLAHNCAADWIPNMYRVDDTTIRLIIPKKKGRESVLCLTYVALFRKHAVINVTHRLHYRQLGQPPLPRPLRPPKQVALAERRLGLRHTTTCSSFLVELELTVGHVSIGGSTRNARLQCPYGCHSRANTHLRLARTKAKKKTSLHKLTSIMATETSFRSMPPIA